eukprot:10297941-Alexandrium_andersonii.AAC.1
MCRKRSAAALAAGPRAARRARSLASRADRARAQASAGLPRGSPALLAQAGGAPGGSVLAT